MMLYISLFQIASFPLSSLRAYEEKDDLDLAIISLLKVIFVSVSSVLFNMFLKLKFTIFNEL